MAQPQDSAPSSNQPSEPRPRRGFLPPQLVGILVPSLETGVMTGGAGTITGIAAAIIKDASPAMWGVAMGINWFMLGSTYWFSRTVMMRAWGGEASLTPREKTKASAIAGCSTGMLGGLIRGPRNIIHGALWFTIFGAAGQGCANKITEWKNAEQVGGGTSWLLHRFSPLKKMSDQEYEDFMADKMLKIETEIALIDDKIADLRAEFAAKEQNQDKLPEKDSSQPEMAKSNESPKAGPQGSGQGRSWKWW